MTHDDRLARLLREAGELDQAPPEAVWHGIRAELGAEPAPEARGGRVLPLLVAAAAGAGLMYAATQVFDDDPAPAEEVVASATLGPVDGEGQLGQAEVVERDGQQVLRVQLDELPDAEDGYLEVWLLRPDVSGLVTLGVLDAGTEEFVLPQGIDLAEYPVVDISVEHLDGDPGHGGNSVVRGEVG
ncbi:anti-sigma factor [Ornithinimicrobium sp. Y1694]|uniref:anti-sigma factor n=1 Tax=Ornithinimicrobium sp. Y1694 TaxID=3418590 RepID=UPI003CF12A37